MNYDLRVDYERVFERFMRACSKMYDRKNIRKWYKLLKDFSKEELAEELELTKGEAALAYGIIGRVGVYLAEWRRGRRAQLADDVVRAVDDFYNFWG